MIEATTHTLDVPSATLTYDVRGGGPADAPVLLLIGSPMGAGGFVTLASHFTDRTVVTYDPRGVERSSAPMAPAQSTVEEHGDDLHRIISKLNAGPNAWGGQRSRSPVTMPDSLGVNTAGRATRMPSPPGCARS